MNKPTILLTDEQIQHFIVEGYIQIKADFDEPVHEGIHAKIEEVFEQEGNTGNNILPRVPEIQRVFDHPRVHGAFTSLLGDDYILNPHRHCHLRSPGWKGGGWHKDNYTNTHNLRQPRFRWVMVLYYPTEVTPEMGPTGVLRRHHFFQGISDPDASKTTEEELGLCGDAGTVNVVHFDVFHRAIPNLSNRTRNMLKFQFVRMKEPTGPSWDARDDAWRTPVDDDARPAALDVWNWLHGKQANGASNGEDIDRLFRVLETGEEENRFAAAYQIGALGESCVERLLASLVKEAEEKEETFLEPCPANVHGYNPTALHAANALTAVGPPAFKAVLEHVTHENWLVRLSLVDVLANMGSAAAEAVLTLTSLLDDGHERVRRAAAMALGQIGVPDEESVSSLLEKVDDDDPLMRKAAMFSLAQTGIESSTSIEIFRQRLNDEDRYNRYYAALALRRMRTPEANEVLLDSLFTSRWCPITDANNKY